MKKIVSITCIKDEEDIIESFVRYHLNIFDMMFFLNPHSNDNVNLLFENLMKEELPIVLINGHDEGFNQKEEYNFLLEKAINEYGADIICPLEIDEFLISDLGNPREILEKMPYFTYYKIGLEFYVPTEFDDVCNKFIPSRINHIINGNMGTYYKVVLTRDLFKHYRSRLSVSNNDLEYDDSFKEGINCETNLNLKIAYFPLRSVEQVTAKILSDFPNQENLGLSSPFHSYYLIFKKLLNDGNIDIFDIKESAKQYALELSGKGLSLEIEDINILKKPINLDFIEDVDMRYEFSINPIPNVLENYLCFTNEIDNIKEEYVLKEKEYSNQINDLEKNFNDLEVKFKKSIILLGDKITESRLLNSVISNNGELTHELNSLKSNYPIKSSSNVYFNDDDLYPAYYNLKSDSEISALKLENAYLKNKNKFSNRFFSYFSYFYLFIKSKPSEIRLNMDLFRTLTNGDDFDTGFYLYVYPDLLDSKICKFFSPELHYVCFGFNEGRVFNPYGFFDVDNKESLLELLKNGER